VDYFNKMSELVFVAVFNTHKLEKKLTKRQKFQKPNDFRPAPKLTRVVGFVCRRRPLALLAGTTTSPDGR